MLLTVSVIIAARNEEEGIARSVSSAFKAGAWEVVVVDGSSSDATGTIAFSSGARVLIAPPMRARQLNLGAIAARGDALIFLHADTELPPGACASVSSALEAGAQFGGFRISFAEPHRRLRLAALLINLRTRITRCPWGDQAQFIRRSAFPGFHQVPLMEDYEMAAGMRRHSVMLPLPVVTSGRRFLQKGIVRTMATNWLIVAGWRLGVSPQRLAAWYRR